MFKVVSVAMCAHRRGAERMGVDMNGMFMFLSRCMLVFSGEFGSSWELKTGLEVCFTFSSSSIAGLDPRDDDSLEGSWCSEVMESVLSASVMFWSCLMWVCCAEFGSSWRRKTDFDDGFMFLSKVLWDTSTCRRSPDNFGQRVLIPKWILQHLQHLTKIGFGILLICFFVALVGSIFALFWGPFLGQHGPRGAKMSPRRASRPQSTKHLKALLARN